MGIDEKLYLTLEREIGDHISSAVVKRGWNYFILGQVQNAEVTVHDTLTGLVRGLDLYAVVVDAEHFRYSTCTCQDDGFCKHMAAAFFYYLSKMSGRVVAEQSYFRLLGINPASQMVRKAEDQEEEVYGVEDQPGQHSDAEQWLAWMDRTYGDTWRKCRHSLHALQPVLSGLKSLSRDWERTRQRLHWTAAIVFVLEQAERAIDSVDSFSRYYHEMSFARMAEPWVSHGYELIGELDGSQLREAELRFAGQLTACVKRRALRQERQLFEWMYWYMALCERLSLDREWHAREMESLLAELEKVEAAGHVGREALHAATGMMYYMSGDDEAAIRHFRSGSFEKSQKLIYPCVSARMEAGNWDMALLWMNFLHKQFEGIRSARNLGPFLTLCRYGDTERPDMPLWMDMMTELLPYSYTELSEHWLEAKRYRDWADLQMLIGVKPEEMDSAALRDAAKADPGCLIPIYHQAVEASIQARNRQSYRMAVKQLKKLERLYKAAKATERWDSYLAELLAKYQRLRALQEELWKGKILT